MPRGVLAHGGRWGWVRVSVGQVADLGQVASLALCLLNSVLNSKHRSEKPIGEVGALPHGGS